MSKRRPGTSQVHSITSAPAPLGADIDRRARRYMVQMGLRTLCFLSAAITWGRVPTAVSIALLIGAVVLPYVAVVLANAGRERPDRPAPFTDLGLAQLTAGPYPGSPASYGHTGVHAGSPSGSSPSPERSPFAEPGRPLWDDEAWERAARAAGSTESSAAPDGEPRGSAQRG